jgi:hypothetical protein
MLKRLLLIALLIGAVILVVQSWPDLQRYRKMRDM